MCSRFSSSRKRYKRSDTGSAALLPQLTDLSRGRFFNVFQLFLRVFCPIYANTPLYISNLNA